VVETPQAEMRVVGTAFSVAVSAIRTRLKVNEGTVEMKARAGATWEPVEAGKTAVAAAGKDQLIAPWGILKEMPAVRLERQVRERGLRRNAGMGVHDAPARERTLLIGLDPDTLEEKKRIETEPVLNVWTDFVCEGSRIWAWGLDSAPTAVDMETGKKVARLSMKLANGSPFDIKDNTLWMWNGKLLKCDPKDGTIRERIDVDVGGEWIQQLAYWNGIVYLGKNGGGRIYAVDAKDGRVLFRANCPWEETAGWRSIRNGGSGLHPRRHRAGCFC